MTSQKIRKAKSLTNIINSSSLSIKILGFITRGF